MWWEQKSGRRVGPERERPCTDQKANALTALCSLPSRRSALLDDGDRCCGAASCALSSRSTLERFIVRCAAEVAPLSHYLCEACLCEAFLLLSGTFCASGAARVQVTRPVSLCQQLWTSKTLSTSSTPSSSFHPIVQASMFDRVRPAATAVTSTNDHRFELPLSLPDAPDTRNPYPQLMRDSEWRHRLDELHGTFRRWRWSLWERVSVCVLVCLSIVVPIFSGSIVDRWAGNPYHGPFPRCLMHLAVTGTSSRPTGRFRLTRLKPK